MFASHIANNISQLEKCGFYNKPLRESKPLSQVFNEDLHFFITILKNMV